MKLSAPRCSNRPLPPCRRGRRRPEGSAVEDRRGSSNWHSVGGSGKLILYVLVTRHFFLSGNNFPLGAKKLTSLSTSISPVRIRHDADNHVDAVAAGVPPGPVSGMDGWRLGRVDIDEGVPRRREVADADEGDIAADADDEAASEMVGSGTSHMLTQGADLTKSPDFLVERRSTTAI